MKKCIVTLLCVCSLLAFSATAFAAQTDPVDWEDLFGIPAPRPEDYSTQEEYNAAYNEWEMYFLDFIRLMTTEDPDPVPDYDSDPADNSIPVESAGANTDETDSNANTSAPADVPMDTDSDDRYPVGSYVDPDGQVWSPSGELLSPPLEEAAPEVEVSDDPLYVPDIPEDDESLVVDTTEPGNAYVVDLRPTDNPPSVLSGLKALVTSIFGEYTPVTTSTVVVQTIDNDTYQYLIETVAPGSAGVDYEWLAGVLLFAILLYCSMKLLGGVLK